ncbi:hypothetical protein [Desulfonema magnum]|uniref:hypothetical protein n=1 Tax=Desulfonema magnum TaxID=45655 RepID=UPI001A9B5519|nr:hypothetical protein [Desulfonema magnum]
MQKLYFCDCEKVFFALRRTYWKNRASHCYKKKFQADPECKNYIFAIAKKYFSHSGENIGKTGHLIATKMPSRWNDSKVPHSLALPRFSGKALSLRSAKLAVWQCGLAMLRFSGKGFALRSAKLAVWQNIPVSF